MISARRDYIKLLIAGLTITSSYNGYRVQKLCSLKYLIFSPISQLPYSVISNLVGYLLRYYHLKTRFSAYNLPK